MRATPCLPSCESSVCPSLNVALASSFIGGLLRLLHGDDVEAGNRRRHALKRELAHGVAHDAPFDAAVDPLRDEDLPGLRVRAQARGEVVDRTDDAVVETTRKADRADGGEALRDADPAPELVAELRPLARQVGYAVAQL